MNKKIYRRIGGNLVIISVVKARSQFIHHEMVPRVFFEPGIEDTFINHTFLQKKVVSEKEIHFLTYFLLLRRNLKQNLRFVLKKFFTLKKHAKITKYQLF